MNQELIKQQLSEWLISFVEKPHPSLNNWAPCPFARKARVDNKFAVLFSVAANLSTQVELSLALLDSLEAIVVCFDHNDIAPDKLSEYVAAHNISLMSRNYVMLEDHPNDKEYVAGVNMNFGKCGLLLIQKLTQLNSASAKLKQQGYYNAWATQDLDSVVNWRENAILPD